MKKMLLASVLALATTAGTAFASVTVYTDGSTYDSTTGITSAPPTSTAANGTQSATDAPFWRGKNDMKVVHFGPPDGGFGGA
jgi:hypothetical protein